MNNIKLNIKTADLDNDNINKELIKKELNFDFNKEQLELKGNDIIETEKKILKLIPENLKAEFSKFKLNYNEIKDNNLSSIDIMHLMEDNN